MIDVKMRAEYGIDGFSGSPPSPGPPRRKLKMAPGWNRSRFVVANTGVNDDALTGRVNNEGMNAHDELSFSCRKMRHHPRHILDGRGRC